MSIIFDRDHYLQLVEEGLLKAREFLWIATANLKDLHVVHGRSAHSLLSDLSALAEKNVAIRILHGSEPSGPFKKSFDRHSNLVNGAIEMQPCPRMHAKIIVMDGILAYSGSANLTGAGLGAKSDRNRNFESGYVTRSLNEIRGLMEYFDGLWMGGQCPDCGRRGECEDPIQ
jgi:phosphatidylserine/phosphatidylglycerophosphate/cardiolipin synthase-like enzyme